MPKGQWRVPGTVRGKVMQVVYEPSAVQHLCESIRRGGRTMGLGPTMGFLHEGHLSLMRRARAENAVLAVSIFVNPTQFGQGEDFDSYPRDLQGDLFKIEKVGADLVFAPSAESIYPADHRTFVEVAEITEGLCGAS